MRNDRANHFIALDGMRGIAAFSVMIGHFGQIVGAYWPAHMFLAVDVFFMMSGFVIAHAYGERLRNGMTGRAYLARRLVRLYPMFILGLLLGAGALCYGARSGVIEYQLDDILRSVVLNAFYIPDLNSAQIIQDVGQIFPADPPAWSLFLETLASGAFLLLFDRRRPALLVVIATCYAAMLGLGSYYYARDNGSFGILLSGGYDTRTVLAGLPRVGFGFTVGLLLHGLARDGTALQAVTERLRRLPCASFLLYAALLAIFAFPWTARGFFPLLMLSGVAPALVLIGAQIRTGPIETRIGRFLGWISYPVYCLHVPIFRLLVFAYGGAAGASYPVIVLGVAASIAAAIVLATWYEEPLRAILSARLDGRGGKQAQSAD